jgi:hypothetical protein
MWPYAFKPTSLIFLKIKVNVWEHLAVCGSLISSYQLWMLEPICLNVDMYIMAPEPISKAYFLNVSQQSVCLYLYPPPPIVAGQRLGKHVPGATKTRNNKRIDGRIILCAARVVSKEKRGLVLPRTSCSAHISWVLLFLSEASLQLKLSGD